MARKALLLRLDSASQQRVLSCLPFAYHLARRYAARVGVPVEDAEDMAVDALLYSAPRYDATRGATYVTFAHLCIQHRLKRVAQNHCSRQRVRQLSTIGAYGDGFDPEDKRVSTADSRIDAQLVLEHAEQVLSPRLFRVLQLHFGEGLSLQQVSQRVEGISKERARQLIFKALEQVRKSLRANTKPRRVEQMAIR